MTPDEWIPDLVSRTEAGQILGCSSQYVEQLTASGRLRGRKVGKIWVYRREAVYALKWALHVQQRALSQPKGNGS